mgnify:CR=1 FL=1
MSIVTAETAAMVSAEVSREENELKEIEDKIANGVSAAEEETSEEEKLG